MKYFIRNHCNIGHAIRALIPNYQELDPKVQWSYNSITDDYDTLTWESSVIPKPTVLLIDLVHINCPLAPFILCILDIFDGINMTAQFPSESTKPLFTLPAEPSVNTFSHTIPSL